MVVGVVIVVGAAVVVGTGVDLAYHWSGEEGRPKQIAVAVVTACQNESEERGLRKKIAIPDVGVVAAVGIVGVVVGIEFDWTDHDESQEQLVWKKIVSFVVDGVPVAACHERKAVLIGRVASVVHVDENIVVVWMHVIVVLMHCCSCYWWWWKKRKQK